jgi:hypothetical protein
MTWWRSAAVVGLVACGSDPEPKPPTWDDVAPILEARCAGCHQAGGIGTMDLTTFAGAKDWADAIATATAARTMPPYLATADGSCGEFAGDETLTDAEIAVFAGWAEGGALEGSGKSVTPPAVPSLATWDLELHTPEDFPVSEGTPFAPSDEYRCYRFPNETDEDWFFTGSEVIPGNKAIVHHALLMVVDPEAVGWYGSTNGAEMDAMEDQDDRPGWDCLGTVGGGARERAMPVEWAPGQGAVNLPEGLGVRVRPQDVLVVQMHYSMPTLALQGQSDSSTFRLRTAPQVEQEAFFAVPDKFIESIYSIPADTLPAGRESVDYTWDMSVDELSYYAYQDGYPSGYKLWGVIPHMHQLGRSQTLTLDPDKGKEQCLVEVKSWDFNWQRVYFYEEPVSLSAGDRMEVRCNYDTTSAPRDVAPGWGTGNEMCLMGMLVTPEP